MTHRFTLRVYYEDTDLAGMVYYANYLRFIERARTEALIALGVDQGALRGAAGVVFVVRRLAVEYLAPARFQDQLEVRTQAAEIRPARVVLDQGVWRGDTILVQARVTLVCIGPGGRAVRLPGAVVRALETLRGP